MLSMQTALALREAGVTWSPARGDFFVVPDRDLDDQVFVLSDMVIDVLEVPHEGSLLAFNGTTEWALDSLEASAAVWVPREDQLRGLLAGTFVSLEHLTGPGDGWAVTTEVAETRERHVDVTPEAAYARALLGLLGRASG